MKILLTLYFTISCGLVIAQNCFECSAGNQTEYYCFQDSTFKHINKTHQSYAYGTGTLIEKKDSVIFKYFDFKPDYVIKESTRRTGDSIQIKFQIVEGISKIPIESTNIFIKRIRIGTTSDSLGIAKLRLSRSELLDTDKLEIQAIGLPYKTISLIELIRFQSANVEIWLSEKVSFYSKEDQVSFLRIKKSKNNLELQNAYGYNYKFKKIRVSKFEKILKDSGLANVH